MPRHDRAYGASIPTKRSGAGNSRRTRKRGKNTYATKQNRRPADGTEQAPGNTEAATATTKSEGAQRRIQGRPQAEVTVPR